MGLRTALRSVARRRALAAAVFGIVVAFGLLAVPGAPVRFSATARVSVAEADAVVSPAALSRAVAGDLSSEFAGATPEDLEHSARRLRSSATLRYENGAAVITCRSWRPSLAIAMANALARSVGSVAAAERDRRSLRAVEAVDREIRALDRKIAEFADALRTREDPGSPGTEDPALRLARARLAELEQARAASALETGDLAARLEALSRRADAGDAGPSKPVDTSESDRLTAELEGARRDLTELRETYPDDWPPVARAAARVEELRGRRDRAVTREILAARFAPLRDLLEEIRSLSARRDRLRSEEAPREARIRELRSEVEKRAQGKPAPIAESEPRRAAEAHFQAAVEARRSLETRKAELETERARDAGVAAPVEPAAAASTGVTGLLIAIAAGLVLGVAAALVAELLAATIRTEHDVRRYVNLPLLGVVPFAKRQEDRLLLAGDARAPLAEPFDTAATLLERRAKEASAKAFGITSPSAGEGKSSVACNLALAVARGGSRVLLVDADLRRPKQHQFLSLPNATGLSSYLSGATDALDGAVVPTAVENLQALVAGPPMENPVPYLRSERFKALIQVLREGYDAVILDLPPVGVAADALVVAPLTDGIVLVLSAPETGKDDAARAKRLVRSAGGALAGCVLTKATVKSRGYYYYSTAPAGAVE